MSRKTFFPLLLLTSAFAAVISACSPVIDQRGNHPDEDKVVEINPGVDDKQRVYQEIGSPSTLSTFNDRTWYYISKKTSTVAFFEPEILEQQILAIRFNKDGIVEDMHIYDEKDGREIAFVDRETPTEGTDFTILQQLLGNIGRFTKKDDSAPHP